MTIDFPFNLKSRQTSGAWVTPRTNGGWRLKIPAGTSSRYRLAQLDDYSNLKRSSFRWVNGIKFELQARVSHPRIPGTWGFGLWNDPFAIGVLAGLQGFRAPQLPQAAWFFYSVPQGYLSLRDDLPGHGWLASTFRSPTWSPFKLALGFPLLPLLAIPGASRKIRASASSIIRQDMRSLNVDPTEWQHYRMRWTFEKSIFTVNGEAVLETRISPIGPLGIVIWIDNQYAAWAPDGKLRFGMCANRNPAWLEIRDLRISS
jgi:hypothetical protein